MKKSLCLTARAAHTYILVSLSIYICVATEQLSQLDHTQTAVCSVQQLSISTGKVGWIKEVI